jgi:hypothetical protein
LNEDAWASVAKNPSKVLEGLTIEQILYVVKDVDTVMGGATATVADAQFLVANDPALIPVTLGQARTCLTFLQAIIL